jgi:hypothetical protein
MAGMKSAEDAGDTEKTFLKIKKRSPGNQPNQIYPQT